MRMLAAKWSPSKLLRDMATEDVSKASAERLYYRAVIYRYFMMETIYL